MKFSVAYFSILLLVNFEARASEIDFNRDIRPILSDNCFHCHGPADQKGDFRIDHREDALENLLPGKPDDSEVVYRIFTDDEDDLMPPPKSHKILSSAQRGLLKRWIAEGAEYQDHWAFVPAQKAPTEAKVHPIDYFISQQLKTVGLELSAEADLRTLIRRVTFDLNGVPPTPAEVDAFLNEAKSSGSDKAFETVVDRLLASQAYGERMTLAWLDLARYGDSSVMHADGPRDMWPWRDWVINAYHSNMPFDQFTTEQIAGDLLPDATLDQKIASGFNRNHATSDEGGAFAEELRVEYVVDRVQTTSSVWMGLTMECAQCHDHKYDPITQKEYFQFFAYFNNTADPGMQTRKGNQKPVVEVSDPIRDQKLVELNKRIEKEKQKVGEYKKSVESSFVSWAKKKTAEFVANGEKVEELPDLAHWFPVDETGDSKLTLLKGKFQTSDRDGGKALKLDGRTEFICSAEEAPNLKGNEPFSFAAWLKTDGNSGGSVFARMDTGNGFRGYDFWAQGGGIGTHIISSWSGDALKVISADRLKKNTWQHIVVSYDGSQKAEGIKIYIDGKLSKNKVEADSLKGSIETKVPFKIGSRSSGGNWKGEVDDIRIYRRALSAEEVPRAKGDLIGAIFATAADQRDERQVEILRTHYLTKEDKAYQKLTKALASVKKQYADLDQAPTTSMIMTDNPPDKMRMTYILDRGQYDSPKEEEVITAGVPVALPAMAKGAPQNRLGLAQWLTAPENPLTARVAINRYWMLLFGEGLVRTAGDFGAQGMPPTHPELLDWLAVDFVESGWDVKRMIKQIVTSRSYRQSSKRLPEHSENDPENLLLAYSPRFRLQGEFIRDQSLAVSGLLVDQVGGPGVKPYQPVNIWNEVSLNGGLRYAQDKGGKLYRKSMYTYWKRSAPMPNMLIFDAPSREKCTIQRARTNTPLQALVTLNDPGFVEASRVFAQRLLKAESEDNERIDLAYQLTLSREANQREKNILNGMLADQRERFTTTPAKAKEFLSVGESKRDESIDMSEHAAWTVIAQTILNLDETLTRN